MKTAGVIVLCLVLGITQAQIEVSPFIINGGRAPLAPYYVLIEYFNAQGLGFFGGGALISNRHILTAATNVQG
jgi:secreted trypsin-like serine protease